MAALDWFRCTIIIALNFAGPKFSLLANLI